MWKRIESQQLCGAFRASSLKWKVCPSREARKPRCLISRWSESARVREQSSCLSWARLWHDTGWQVFSGLTRASSFNRQDLWRPKAHEIRRSALYPSVSARHQGLARGKTMPQTYNKPMERTPPCCALRRRSSARYMSAGLSSEKGASANSPSGLTFSTLLKSVRASSPRETAHQLRRAGNPLLHRLPGQ